ncbi:MAG TPA: sulfatase-like hydrolase/transferase, partial [Verrucomicrobiae bacterium]
MIYGANATGNGTYNLNGGILYLRAITNAHTGGTAVFNFNGGVLKPVASSTFFLPNQFSANVQAGGAIIDTTNWNVTIAQNLAAAGGGLTKWGSGILTLTGTNTYSGSTVISNGTLLINGWNSGAGDVNVANGTLGGTGIVAGVVNLLAAGGLAPGANALVGSLALQSDLNWAGKLLVKVDKTQALTNDTILVAGNPVNSGTGTLVLTNLNGNWVAGDQFRICNHPINGGASLTLIPAVPAPGLAWTNRLGLDGTMGVITAPIVATPADLIDLSLNIGGLLPVFNSNVLAYAVAVGYTNSSIVITPVAGTPGAAITILANGMTNGALSSHGTAIPLKPGTNWLSIQVMAPDQSVTKTYVINVTRKPPNVIVMLADDQGFTDWSCYGSEIATPNIDRLATEGLRFRQFYNCARCSPTRCALLTGLYTAQVAVDPAQALPNLRNDNNVTIAELLATNGYRTYMSGKWHLGNGALLPEARGFQQVFRYISGTDHNEDTWNTNAYTFISGNGELSARNYGAGQFYQPDAIGDYALDFIQNDLVTHANDKPFFLYLAFGSAHFPIQAPAAWGNTNVPLYSAGWDAVRHQRFTNAILAGALDPQTVLSPNEGTAPWGSVPAEIIPDWNSLAADRQADLARRMAIYAAMVQKMDANIGRVVEQLRIAGQLDNTLIFLMSDNGGNHEGSVFGQTGGVINPTPLTGTNLANMGLSGQPVIYLGGGWAHVNNTPFRLYKHFDHEGGIRTPMIVHWPQGLSRTNQWENLPGHVIDIMATIVAATGARYPAQYNNHAVLPLEGHDLSALFTSTNTFNRNLGFEHEGNRAWVSGAWKLVTKNFTAVTGGPVANTLELYDLNHDA